MVSSSPFPNDDFLYGISALVTVAMQLFFFSIAYGCNFDLVTDLAGSSNFILLALLSLFLGGNFGERQLVITSLLIVSKLYLGSFLLFRVCTRKKDARFDEIRENFFVFLGFWVFQMFWAFLVSMPVIFINSRPVLTGPLVGVDFFAWGIFFVGLVIQVFSDLQKHKFRANPDNKGKFCDVGLWHYSRHPNYLGEIMMSFAMFAATIPFNLEEPLAAVGWASAASPVFTLLILLWGTGLPTGEGANLKRYYDAGRGSEWEAYARTTSPVVLMPNSLYAALPECVKRFALCEYNFLKYQPAKPAEVQPEDPLFQDKADAS